MRQTFVPAGSVPRDYDRQPASATVAEVVRRLATIESSAHIAAAAYLMKHCDTTALVVVNARTDKPDGFITSTDIARAAADGRNLNTTRVSSVTADRNCRRHGHRACAGQNLG